MGNGNPFCQPGSYNSEWTQQVCNTQGLGVFGGNPHLTPEKSQNYDFGAVISPTADVGITLDYFRVLVKNTIGGVPAASIYADPTTFANYIVTNNAGTLTPSIDSALDCTPYTSATCGYIKLNSQNTGSLATSGVDLSVQYTQHTAYGTFREDLEGTAVTQFDVEQYDGGPTLNLVGWANQGAPAIRWQHELRLDWTSVSKMWGGGLSNRFYSRYVDQFPDGNGNQRNVASYSLLDGYVSVKPTDKLTVLFGIKNILDTSPPFTNAYQPNFAAGYNALIGDPLLRNVYVNLKYSFF
jgi:iron complex outermembrane receptor protein